MKVRCKLCNNTDGTVCNVKGFKVGQNKSRICDDFELAIDKITEATKMEATYVPFHLRSKKEYKKHIAEEVKQRIVTNATKQTNPDCLANFRATVLED